MNICVLFILFSGHTYITDGCYYDYELIEPHDVVYLSQVPDYYEPYLYDAPVNYVRYYYPRRHHVTNWRHYRYTTPRVILRRVHRPHRVVRHYNHHNKRYRHHRNRRYNKRHYKRHNNRRYNKHHSKRYNKHPNNRRRNYNKRNYRRPDRQGKQVVRNRHNKRRHHRGKHRRGRR